MVDKTSMNHLGLDQVTKELCPKQEGKKQAHLLITDFNILLPSILC